MKWLAEQIKKVFPPAPSKQEQQSDSMRCIQAQYALRHETQRFKAQIEDPYRRPLDSIHPAAE